MTSNRPYYTLLNHTADMGIRVWGHTLAELFEHAARALTEILLKERPSQKESLYRLSIAGEDPSDLLVRWLGEILYLLEGEDMVVVDISIDAMTETRLDARLYVAPFDPKKHEVLTEIKAVTYHQIEVVRERNGWRASVIFDL